MTIHVRWRHASTRTAEGRQQITLEFSSDPSFFGADEEEDSNRRLLSPLEEDLQVTRFAGLLHPPQQHATNSLTAHARDFLQSSSAEDELEPTVASESHVPAHHPLVIERVDANSSDTSANSNVRNIESSSPAEAHDDMPSPALDSSETADDSDWEDVDEDEDILNNDGLFSGEELFNRLFLQNPTQPFLNQTYVPPLANNTQLAHTLASFHLSASTTEDRSASSLSNLSNSGSVDVDIIARQVASRSNNTTRSTSHQSDGNLTSSTLEATRQIRSDLASPPTSNTLDTSRALVTAFPVQMASEPALEIVDKQSVAAGLLMEQEGSLASPTNSLMSIRQTLHGPTIAENKVDPGPQVEMLSQGKVPSFGPNGQGWPKSCMPVEVYEKIAEYLPYDSLKQMRLVCQEFERNISSILFHTVVVPFREEIYGMVVQNAWQFLPDRPSNAREEGGLSQPPIENTHNGMRVFQAWGPRIKRFAMAFEVDEQTLENPPAKGKFETHQTYWGAYDWPHPYYNRFELCEGLEKKADEFRSMSDAISKLTEVTELALSIDSGLGWINGPDISDRARLFREKPKIFGKRQKALDPKTEGLESKWRAIKQKAEASPIRITATLGDNVRIRNRANLIRLSAVALGLAPGAPPALTAPASNQVEEGDIRFLRERPLIFNKINLERMITFGTTDRTNGSDASRFLSLPLVPNTLTSAQREWLLETEWAQRAFLSSFCMALCDNQITFQNVRMLSFSRLSSRYLSTLNRGDVWNALAQIESLTINVSPDWRNIYKSDGGLVEAPIINPCYSTFQFYDLLKQQICEMKGLKELNIGFVGGGEHQTGIYGRNRSILPAPILPWEDLSKTIAHPHFIADDWKPKTLVVFHYVKHLTFTNTWFSPLCLKSFLFAMRASSLKTLDLNSTSLTASMLDEPSRFEELEVGEAGFYSLPQGPPRCGDPAVGNLFELCSPQTTRPSLGAWAITALRRGSWPELMDKCTPGADIDMLRYAYQYYDEDYYREVSAQKSKAGQLETINFDSCGYVRLVNASDRDQDDIGEVRSKPPKCLRQRASDLAKVMMLPDSDYLLGQIVPSLPANEDTVLSSAFLMRFGWEDKLKAAENREDAQPMGGSGRFSGILQRLTFSPLYGDNIESESVHDP